MSDSQLRELVRADAGLAPPQESKVQSVPRSFGFKMRRVQVAYNRQFMAAAGRGDIPVNQIGALALVVRNPGITPKELAGLLYLDAAQVTPLIKQLDVRGHITRTKSTSDNRSHSLHATPTGSSEYQRLKGIISAVEDEFLGDVLQPDEISQLLGIFDRLEAAARLRA
jgi:MarR family transcriptional regulator, temperature-dependent positive regulator of motility